MGAHTLPLPSSPRSIPAVGAGTHPGGAGAEQDPPGLPGTQHPVALDLQSTLLSQIQHRRCRSSLQRRLYNLTFLGFHFASGLEEPLVNPRLPVGDTQRPAAALAAGLVPLARGQGCWHHWHPPADRAGWGTRRSTRTANRGASKAEGAVELGLRFTTEPCTPPTQARQVEGAAGTPTCSSPCRFFSALLPQAAPVPPVMLIALPSRPCLPESAGTGPWLVLAGCCAPSLLS